MHDDSCRSSKHDALIADSGLLHAIFCELVRSELNDLDLVDEVGFDAVLEILIERVKNPAARHWLRESHAGDYFIDDTEALNVCLESKLLTVTIAELADSPEGLRSQQSDI